MKRAPSNLRAIVPLAFLAVAAVLTCGPYPPLPPPPPAGPLPPGVSSDPAQFRQQVSGLTRGQTHIRSRPGRCLNGGCTVEIEIEVLGTVIPNPNDAPDQGFAYANIRNMDASDEEAKYRLDPTTQADYYIWMDSLPGFNKTRWTLLRVPKRGGNVENKFSRTLTECHPGPPALDVDFAEYKHPRGSPCRVAMDDVDPGVNLASSFSSAPFAPLLKRIAALVSDRAGAAPGAWFGCGTGCCR